MEQLTWFERDCLILILLGCANTFPIAARNILGKRWEMPVDAGACWLDRRPLLGPHKTWRGLISSVAGTTLVSSLTPVGMETGLYLAALSMAGDLVSSFIKRRMNLESGARAIGLDQGIEVMLPLLCLRHRLSISLLDIGLITLLFFAVELSVSPVLYRLGIRRNPH